MAKSAKSIAAAVAKQEKQWQAQCDARTLMDAAKLSQDKSRLSAAQAEAKKIAMAASAAAGTVIKKRRP